MSEHFQIACEMLGIETIRMSYGERYDESLLPARLRGMLDTALQRIAMNQVGGAPVNARQLVACIVATWEATKPEALCDAVNNDLFNQSRVPGILSSSQNLRQKEVAHTVLPEAL
jgi:hypothetical protein